MLQKNNMKNIPGHLYSKVGSHLLVTLNFGKQYARCCRAVIEIKGDYSALIRYTPIQYIKAICQTNSPLREGQRKHKEKKLFLKLRMKQLEILCFIQTRNLFPRSKFCCKVYCSNCILSKSPS